MSAFHPASVLLLDLLFPVIILVFFEDSFFFWLFGMFYSRCGCSVYRQTNLSGPYTLHDPSSVGVSRCVHHHVLCCFPHLSHISGLCSFGFDLCLDYPFLYLIARFGLCVSHCGAFVAFRCQSGPCPTHEIVSPTPLEGRLIRWQSFLFKSRMRLQVSIILVFSVVLCGLEMDLIWGLLFLSLPPAVLISLFYLLLCDTDWFEF